MKNLKNLDRLQQLHNLILKENTGTPKDLSELLRINKQSVHSLMNELKEYRDKNIIYAGFVEDITLYFKGADIFLNPVIEGGGIKTKVVEALGYNLSVISTKSGAIGIPTELTNGKLTIVEDTDWENFINSIYAVNITSTIPQEYFEHFYLYF